MPARRCALSHLRAGVLAAVRHFLARLCLFPAEAPAEELPFGEEPELDLGFEPEAEPAAEPEAQPASEAPAAEPEPQVCAVG